MILVFWEVAPGLIRPEPQWAMLLLFVTGWAAVVPAAWLTHILIEKPGRRLVMRCRSATSGAAVQTTAEGRLSA
jgi:peptidoglycan/LPS O-acetylase OafA/YrhL